MECVENGCVIEEWNSGGVGVKERSEEGMGRNRRREEEGGGEESDHHNSHVLPVRTERIIDHQHCSPNGG